MLQKIIPCGVWEKKVIKKVIMTNKVDCLNSGDRDLSRTRKKSVFSFVLFGVLLGMLSVSSVFASTLPIAATDIAAKWDKLYWFLVILSAIFFVIVVGAMVLFAIQYRQSKSPKSTYIDDNHFLEAFWTIVPTILLLLIFGWGYHVYRKMVTPPTDAFEVRVIGKQWLWQFQYDDGRTTIGDLYVPLNRPVKLLMTSTDVIHSFFVPNFRIKSDVVPGMYTTVWFHATIPGKHQVFCTEYCGADHSGMLAQVIALEEDDWEKWRNGGKIAGYESVGVGGIPMPALSAPSVGGLSPLAKQGEGLFQTKGCVSCHSVDGTAKVGPSLKGTYNREVELADGSKVTADMNYIRESIEVPTAKVVKGFAPSMPPYKGMFTEEELNAVIEYIRSIK